MACHRRPKRSGRARVTVLTETDAAAVAFSAQALYASSLSTSDGALLWPGYLPGEGFYTRPAECRAGRHPQADHRGTVRAQAAATGINRQSQAPGFVLSVPISSACQVQPVQLPGPVPEHSAPHSVLDGLSSPP